jgi:Flp pilus assembly protein TadG
MLTKPANHPVSAHVVRRFNDYLEDEGGSITIFVVLVFVVMLMLGGIAVDVMRFETRRVALQQTLDRAVLAASSMTQKIRTPQDIASEWFTVAGLGNEFTYDYSAATVTGSASVNTRKATATATVRSYNHFMQMLDIPYFQAPVVAAAAEGIARVEVMLVLDITGSMSSRASPTDSRSKIAALRDAADRFVTIVKGADSKNGVSIGLVPYASQVNVPASVRSRYNVTNLSHWDFVANQGVPETNCLEIPFSSYTSTALSTTTSISMSAVADLWFSGWGRNSGETLLPHDGNYYAASDYPPSIRFGPRICTTKADNPATAINEAEDNQVLLPTKDLPILKDRISRLTADGNTSIFLGMRWGTALIDQTASSIYTITDSDGAVRPFQNNDPTVRKIIILMTDGEHVSNSTVSDGYKSGPSPFWRGTDGRYAISFNDAHRGPFTGTLPHADCSGWALANNRTFFAPHLKANAVKYKRRNSDPEGESTGTWDATAGACDPRAWLAPVSGGNPTWPQLDASGNIMRDASNNPIMVTTRRLDWSEAWRFLRLEYMIGQMNNRANLSGSPGWGIWNTINVTYVSESSMNSYLQQNCTAAKAAGIEIYGIAFAAPSGGRTQIRNCASPDDLSAKYFFDATNDADLTAAFNTIASDITDLRLTQ